MAEKPAFRTRYPFRAVAAIAAAGLLFLGELAMLAVWLMPLVPLVPLFVMIMIGNACLLSAAVNYASSLARLEPVTSDRAETRARTRAPKAEALGAEAPRAA